MKIKLCCVNSDVDTSHLVEANVRFLDADRYDLTTVFLSPEIPRLYETLKRDGFDVRFFRCRGKKDLPLALSQMYRLFGRLKPDIVHTNLFNSSVTGLTAAKLRGVKKRVMTRHHSVEAHRYHPHAVYYDKYFNAVATDIVAITDMVADVLVNQEGVAKEKVKVVHHGFDMGRFDEALERPTNLKAKYGLADSFPVVGVISRFIHWKGIQFIIPAFKELLRKYPAAKLVLANAGGSYEPEVRALLAGIGDDRYCLIPFERQVEELYKSFDVFVHVPIGREYEAFGQVYVEALAMKVPSVFTLSGVANDFVEHERNAMVVPFEDSAAIFKAVVDVIENQMLKNKLVSKGAQQVRDLFGIEKMIAGLDAVYSVGFG